MKSIAKAVTAAVEKGEGDNWSLYCCPTFQLDQHAVLFPEFRDFNIMLECTYWGAREACGFFNECTILLRQAG